jgi:ATP-binding cassette subfamily B (MDR/TAP) protein 1
MDVVTAFLYGSLDEVIYMRQPQGFTRPGQEDMVCRLQKLLYGLKKSPRQWNKRFDDFMKSQGFKRSIFDPCVYLKRITNQVFGFVLLLLYVDDMLIAAKEKSEVLKLKRLLCSEFSMKDLGQAQRILGMDIKREKGKLVLTQEHYALKVLARFNMQDAKVVTTPLASHFKLSEAMCPLTDDDKGIMSKVPYESAVGSLMYLMVCTRPDIAYAVGKVSRYMSNPSKPHWEAVKWILRYIKGTVGHGLVFDASLHDASTLVGYVDADFAQDLDKRRSTTGYIYTLAGGCVSWRSTIQKCISQSTTEAEYVAVAEATKEAIWLQRLVTEIGLVHDPVHLHCDSQSALHLAVNQVMDSRVKHIDVRYHFLREVVADMQIKLVKIDGKLNPADIFTKVVPLVSFARHRTRLQIVQTD